GGPRGAGRIDLSEAVEALRQQFWLNAFARVGDDDPDVLAAAFGPEFDAPAGGSELDRAREQVPDDLLQPRRVAHYDCGFLDCGLRVVDCGLTSAGRRNFHPAV